MNLLSSLMIPVHMTRAWLQAELLRQASSPSWLLLAVLWSLVLAILVLVSLNQATHQHLAAEQHIFAHAIQMAPQLLIILPLLLLPALGVEALAGRRENGRLEHILTSGGRAMPLLWGNILASGLLGFVLIIPIVLIALVVHSIRPTPIGAILATSMVLWSIVMVATALGLACGAWSSKQLSGGMLATGAALLWWLADMLAPLLGANPSHPAPWALAQVLDHAAHGRLDLTWLGGQAMLLCTLIVIAHGGLARGAQGPRRLSSVAQLALCIALLQFLGRHPLPWQLAESQTWQLNESALTAASQLEDLEVVALINGHNNRAKDILARTGMRHIQLSLQAQGAKASWIDRAIQPSLAGPWYQRLDLEPDEWDQPLLVLRAHGRERIVRGDDIISANGDNVKNGNNSQRIHHNQVLTILLRELSGSLPEVAWYQGAGCRPSTAQDNYDLQRSSSEWFHSTAAAGAQVIPISSFKQLHQHVWRAVVIPGPSRPLSASEAEALHNYLHAGGSVVLALDGRETQVLPSWQQFFKPWGLQWQAGHLHDHQHHTALLATSDHPTLSRSDDFGAGCLWSHARPLFINRGTADEGLSGSLETLVSSREGTHYFNPQHKRSELHLARPLAISWQGNSDQQQNITNGRFLVLAGIDVFNAANLGRESNRALSQDIAAWMLQRPSAELVPIELDRREHIPAALSRWLGIALVLIIPGLALAAGMSLRWWRRRS